jgi:SpoVK/Ycf46/Vps4 family AAA+-type ATPase
MNGATTALPVAAAAACPHAVADILVPLCTLPAPHKGDCAPSLPAVFRPVLAVLFLDEIDALCPRRTGAGDTGVPTTDGEARLVAQLLTLIDGFRTKEDSSPSATAASAAAAEAAASVPFAPSTGGLRVLVVGATNRRAATDPALRRPGRLDRELVVAPPDARARAQLLRALLARVPLAADAEPDALAEACVGFVAADLHALVREAALAALREATAAAAVAAVTISAAGTGVAAVAGAEVGLRHFCAALTSVGAASLRGHALTALNDKAATLAAAAAASAGAGGEAAAPAWASDVGGLEDVKFRLRQTVEWPLRYAETYRSVSRPFLFTVLMLHSS